MRTPYDIIFAPVVTEATMDGVASKKYAFKVASDATKPEIADAVEKLFSVEVKSVNTITMKKKPKRMGVHAGKRADWKKAIVKLTADSKTIELFEN